MSEMLVTIQIVFPDGVAPDSDELAEVLRASVGATFRGARRTSVSVRDYEEDTTNA